MFDYQFKDVVHMCIEILIYWHIKPNPFSILFFCGFGISTNFIFNNLLLNAFPYSFIFLNSLPSEELLSNIQLHFSGTLLFTNGG